MTIWLTILSMLFGQMFPFPGPGRVATCSLFATGTTFNEGFECGSYTAPDGTSGLMALWARNAGTADSIVDCPAGQTGKCLSMVQPGASAAYINAAGSFPATPAGNTFTFGFAYRWHTDSLAAFGAQRIAGIGSTAASSNDACVVRIENNNPTRRIYGGGGASSQKFNLSADTWVTPSVQCDTSATANASCVSLTGDLSCCGTGADTATCKRFTAAAKAASVFTVGSDAGASVAHEYHISDLWLSSAAGNENGDSVMFDLETGSDTDAISTTNLTAATRKGNGTWAQITSGGYTISTAYNLGLNSSVTVAGTSYDGTGTRSLKYDYSSNANPKWQYSFFSNSSQATLSYTFRTDRLTALGEYAAFHPIDNTAGTDYAVLQVNDGKLYLETLANPSGDPDVGAKYSYSINTVYKVAVQFNTGGPHKMWLWDSSCNLLSYQEKAAVGGVTLKPSRLNISRADSAAPQTGSIWFDNFVGNYKGGVTAPTCR